MIVSAAIIGHDGKVYALPAPKRHHHIINHMTTLGHPTPINGEQGFIDSQLGYVTRKMAAIIALDENQITKLEAPPNLFSEDLW